MRPSLAWRSAGARWNLQNRIKRAGGKWNPAKKVWEVKYGRAVETGLAGRVGDPKKLMNV